MYKVKTHIPDFKNKGVDYYVELIEPLFKGQYSSEDLHTCIWHTIKEVRKWIKDPYDYGGILLHELGTFHLNLTGINGEIRSRITFLKKIKEQGLGPENMKSYLYHCGKIKELWKLRQLAIQYEHIRTDTNRYNTGKQKELENKN